MAKNTRGSKKRKQEEKTKSDEPKPKRVQKGIDMKNIPQCLLDEGYTPEEEELEEPNTEKKVPDYLLCPICKELFVEPEMFRCGHTVCKVCKNNAPREMCAVCKIPMYTDLGTPNFVLKQLIEDQFPTLFQKRKKELDETLALQQLRMKYEHCSRFNNLIDFFKAHMSATKYDSLPGAVEKVRNAPNFEPPISLDEAKFVVSWTIHSQVKDYSVLGNYLLYCHSHDAGRVADWLGQNPTPANLQWAPLLLFSVGWGHTFGTPDQYAEKLKSLAKLYKLDYGSPPTDFLVWHTKPLYWLREMPEEILKEEDIHDDHIHFNGHHFHHFGGDSSDSDSDGWIYSEDEDIYVSSE